MVQKFPRSAFALQPLATALFANSPFTEGKPNGFLSYRFAYLVGYRSGPHRGCCPSCSRMASAMAGGPNTCWMCRCYFRLPRREIYRRGGAFLSAIFLMASCRLLPGERPTQSDWWDHLSTAFPRSAAEKLSRNARRRMAGRGTGFARFPPSGSGFAVMTRARLMRRGIWSRAGRWRNARRSAAPRPGWRWMPPSPAAAPCAISGARPCESRTRGWRPAPGSIPRATMKPASSIRSTKIVASGKVPAQRLLDAYHGEWNGDISRVYEQSF